RAKGVSAHADVEPEDTGAVQARGLIETGVVLGDDRGERELTRPIEIAIGVVIDERVPRTGPVAWSQDVNTRERVRDVLDDRLLIHGRPPSRWLGPEVATSH